MGEIEEEREEVWKPGIEEFKKRGELRGVGEEDLEVEEGRKEEREGGTEG